MQKRPHLDVFLSLVFRPNDGMTNWGSRREENPSTAINRPLETTLDNASLRARG